MKRTELLKFKSIIGQHWGNYEHKRKAEIRTQL